MAMDPELQKGLNGKRVLPVVGAPKKAAPVQTHDGSVDVDEELRRWEEAERERLGIKRDRQQWVDNMLNAQMTRKERDHVTILLGGLTQAHDFLAEAALRGIGYKVEHMDPVTNESLQKGKEFGNRGQCNPTYYTVGNLVKHLTNLRDVKGLSTEHIIKNYAFLSAGACGPCRFGMYVTEFRKALRDAGFDGFRVMLFQQTGGISQATGEDVGLEMGPTFFTAIVKAVVTGDVLNAMMYRIRPYEVEPGATNIAVENAKRIVYKALIEQTNIFVALYHAKKEFAKVKVDRLRAKPKVSIIGEFWAMTTEGDGNYHLQKFIEQEGGEDDIQLITAWLLYNIWECARDTRVRQDLRGADKAQYGLDGLDEFGAARRLATMRLAEWGLRLGFQAFALPIGLYHYHLADMDYVAEVAKDYYSNDLRGGEGHMEVGKLIMNTVMNKAHLTVSVKPFGCMPSSGVSDGIQSLITARYPGTIFCAVETSGDGATNFYSRVQMYLFKARILAEQEFERALQEHGVTREQVETFLREHPKYNSPFHRSPHVYAGTAADLVAEVAPFITKTRTERAVAKARSVAEMFQSVAKKAPGTFAKVVETVRDPEFQDRVRHDAMLLKDIAEGRAKERFGPLVERLAHRALFNRDPSDPVAHEHVPVAYGDAE